MSHATASDTPPKLAFRRHERKYVLPVEDLDDIRRDLLPHVRLDPYCENRPDHRYTVRSVYYDTRDLRFYYERADGLKTRKKLRIRTYGGPGDKAPAFLEIKRKRRKKTHKERAVIPFAELPGVLNGAEPTLLLEGRSPPTPGPDRRPCCRRPGPPPGLAGRPPG